MSATISIRGASVRYGAVIALNDVSIEASAGTIHGIIGPNGAGKTTLLDAASGFISHASGDVVLEGKSLQGMPPHRRVRAGLRRTFQQSRCPEDVAISRYVRAVARRQLDPGELNELLALVGAPDSGATLGELDVPSRRLVELVSAVAGRPQVLMLDEPAAGLGEDESMRLAEAIQQIPELINAAILLIEHDIELVRKVCSEITVLDFGSVIGQGPPDEVLASRVVKLAYLGELEDES